MMAYQKRIRIFGLIISLVCMLLTAMVPYQQAGGVGTLEIRFSDLGYESDETLIGIRADRVYGISWPEGWVPEPGSTLKLSFSHSPALKVSSSVVVDWNNTRLGSTLLTKSNADRGVLEIDIPENLIQPGYNALRLEFYMGIHDDFCEDLVNPAIWATIHSDSLLTLNYSNAVPDLDLGRFPYPLVDSGDLKENYVSIVVPDIPTAAELNAAAIVSAKLGKEATYRELALESITAEEAKTAKGNLVYIALADKLPAIIDFDLSFLKKQNGAYKLFDQKQKALPDDAGLLWEELSKNDPSSISLVITAENETGLLNAAAALGNDLAYPQFKGQMGIVLNVQKPEINKAFAGRTVSLKELGYADTAARGFRNQTVNFNIPLPLAWMVNSEVSFEIHFAHSALLHEKQSAMNILLNGVPVTNIVLNRSNVEDSWATVRLPSRLFKVGNNQLTIESTIKLIEGYINEEDCGANYEDEAWVVIYSDSRLHLPDAPDDLVRTLLDYPYAFIGDTSLVELALIVPDEMDSVIAKSVIQIAGRLGRYSSGAALYPTVQTAKTAMEAKTPYPFQILIGLSSQNSAIQKINDQLPLPFDTKTNQLLPHEKIPSIVSEETGYLQVSQNHSEVFLVVSGTTPESLLWSSGAVSDPELMMKLKGNAAILEGEEAILPIITEEQVEAPPQAPTETGYQPVTWVMWAAYSFIALTVLVLVFLWVTELIKRRQVRKNL
jgi:hypothetical protein